MKAEELMVGDYLTFSDVQNDSNCPKLRVIAINEEDVYVSVDGDPVADLCDPKELAGIPLTPEILEKNGFGKIYDDELLTRLVFIKETTKIYNTSVIISLYKEPIAGGLSLVEIDTCPKTGEGLNHIHVCDILHVHELQHALRLCGINKTIEL